MADELHPYGVTIGMDVASGTSYATLGRLIAVAPPAKQRAVADRTNFSSSNFYKEIMKGWKTGMPTTFRVRFERDTFEDLDDEFEDDTDALPTFLISLPLRAGEATKSRWAFAAAITNLGVPEMSVDGENLVEVNVELTPSGKPVFTKGAA